MKIKGIFWPLAVIMLLMCSCSKEKPLFETVPAESPVVVAVDGSKLFKELDGVLKDIPNGSEMLNVAKELGATVNLDNLVIFLNKSHDLFLTTTVTDAAALDKQLTESGTPKSSDGGFDLYSIRGYTVAVRGDQVWVCDLSASKTPDAIKAALKNAGDRSVADVSELCDQLSDNKLITMAVNYALLNGINAKGNADITEWYVITAEIKDNAISGKVCGLNGKGEMPDYNKALTKINTSVLQYVPQGFPLVVAAGLTPDVPWESTFNAVAKAAGMDPMQIAQMQLVFPYLKALDGTMMIAMNPMAVNSSGIPEFIVMAHMKQEMVNQTVNDILQFAINFCSLRRAENEPFTTCRTQWGNFYVGNIDGYLTISSIEPNNNNGSALAGKFTGKEYAVSINMPSFSQLGLNTKTGIDFLMTADGDNYGKYTLRLTGTNAPILQALAEIIKQL